MVTKSHELVQYTCSIFVFSAIDAVSDCYWNSLKDVCPPRGRYLYSKLAEVYLPNICSKL